MFCFYAASEKRFGKPVNSKSKARKNSMDKDREPIITSTRLGEFNFLDSVQGLVEPILSRSTSLSNGDDHSSIDKMPKLVKQKSHTNENGDKMDKEKKVSTAPKSIASSKQSKEKSKTSDISGEKTIRSASTKNSSVPSKSKKGKPVSSQSSSSFSSTTTSSQSQSSPTTTPKSSKTEGKKVSSSKKPAESMRNASTSNTAITPKVSTTRRITTPSATPVPMNVSTPTTTSQIKHLKSSNLTSTSASVFATPSPGLSVSGRNTVLESCPPLPEPDLNLNTEPVNLNTLAKSSTLWGSIAVCKFSVYIFSISQMLNI